VSGTTLDVDLPPTLLEQLKALLPQGFAAEHVEINFHGKTSGS
jgi:hypothetical protein